MRAKQKKSRQKAGMPELSFCPVAGCLCADSLRARGFDNPESLHRHVNNHLSGTLQGRVPDDWLAAHNKSKCIVCGLLVAQGRDSHPTCRAKARAANPVVPNNRPASSTAAYAQLPDLEEVFANPARTLRHVHAASRMLWAKVFVQCLAAVALHKSMDAWTDLAKATLTAPRRGGHKRQEQLATFTSDRLSRWLQGERASLWSVLGGNTPAKKRARIDEEANKLKRADALAREGFDRKACAALLSFQRHVRADPGDGRGSEETSSSRSANQSC